jgi:hypothetical protein
VPLFRSYHHHHHHISVMQLGHLLTRSVLTNPEVSSKVCHDIFCQLENSVSLPWVNMSVQRLKVAIVPLDLPCSRPVTYSGEILTTGKSHGKKPDRFSCWSLLRKYITMHGPQNVRNVLTVFALVLSKWSAAYTSYTPAHAVKFQLQHRRNQKVLNG